MKVFSAISKWFADRLAVRKLASVTTASSGGGLLGAFLADEKSAVQLVNQYKGWVYACASRNSRAVAQVPLRLFVVTKKGQKAPKVDTKAVDSEEVDRFFSSSASSTYARQKARSARRIEEVLEHPFLTMMAQANPIHDGFELLELIVLYQELIGKAFVLKVRDGLGTVAELWPLLSHHARAIPSPTTVIKGYEYGYPPNTVHYKPEEIAYFRYPDPGNYLEGMSPLQAAATSVDLQASMDDYEKYLFKNRARPDQVITTTQPTRRETRKRLEEDFNRVLRGVSKTGKTIVMPYGLDLKQLAFSPKELAYLASEKRTRDDIAVIFDIPPNMFAPEGGNRAKANTDEYLHAKYGISPRCRRLEQRLNQDVVSGYSDRLFCAFDSPVPEDQEFLLKERVANLRVGYTTINQEREKKGEVPVEWGDIPILPANMIPLGSVPPGQAKGGEGEAPLDKTKPGRTKKPGKEGKD